MTCSIKRLLMLSYHLSIILSDACENNILFVTSYPEISQVLNIAIVSLHSLTLRLRGKLKLLSKENRITVMCLHWFESSVEKERCLSTAHCLNHLYTANRKPAGSVQLRHRGHNLALPTIHLEFNKIHFGALVLFGYV